MCLSRDVTLGCHIFEKVMPCVMLGVLGSGAKNGESDGVSETAKVEGSVYCDQHSTRRIRRSV